MGLARFGVDEDYTYRYVCEDCVYLALEKGVVLFVEGGSSGRRR